MVRRSRSASSSSSASTSSSTASSRSSRSSSSASSSSSGSSRGGRRDRRSNSKSVSPLPRRGDRRRSPPSSSKKAVSPPPAPLTKIVVTKLTRNVTQAHVSEIFSIYGSIKSVSCPRNHLHPEFGRGDATITYEKREDAEKALRHMNGGQIDGLVVSCDWAPVGRANDSRRSRSRSPLRRRRNSRTPPRRRSPAVGYGRRRDSPRRFRRSPPRFRGGGGGGFGGGGRRTGVNSIPLGRRSP